MKTKSVMCLAIVCAIALLPAAALAQAPSAPKPGAEHAKLAYFVGVWQSEGEMKASPFGPGGKTVSQDNCQWFEGKFAVVCHYQGTGPKGPMKGVGILGYNPEENVYTYYGLDNTGMTMMSVARGTRDGDTWNYTDESKMGGKTVKGRYIIKELSPDSYTFKWEFQGDGGTWNTVAEGKSTRKS